MPCLYLLGSGPAHGKALTSACHRTAASPLSSSSPASPPQPANVLLCNIDSRRPVAKLTVSGTTCLLSTNAKVVSAAPPSSEQTCAARSFSIRIDLAYGRRAPAPVLPVFGPVAAASSHFLVTTFFAAHPQDFGLARLRSSVLVTKHPEAGTVRRAGRGQGTQATAQGMAAYGRAGLPMAASVYMHVPSHA